MLEEGRISPALASAALERHRASGDRFEEALLGCGLPESMLLRHLAEMFNTRFISTKTLSGALVPRPTLSRLPRRLAERYQVVPIRFGEDDVLTVVATEPANPQLLENVRVAAGARLVMGLVARPAAISAAIAKLYGGDNEAFGSILSREHGAAQAQDPFPDVQLDTSAFDSPAAFDSPGAFDTPGAFDSPGYDNQNQNQSFDAQRFGERNMEHPGYSASGVENQPFDEAPHTDVEALPPSYELAQSYESAQGYDTSQSYDRPSGSGYDYDAGSAYESPASFDGAPQSPEAMLDGAPPTPNGATNPPAWVPSSDPDPELDMGIARARSLALGDASKLAESLMIIHERTRGSLKSHSVRVARLSYSLCRQLDLSEAQAAQAWAIGLFHDLGKSQQNHLTALNVWQLQDYEVTARAQYKNPGRLLKNADVPETVLTAIQHMYERFDGKGFPDGLADEAIPFQSRVVALCDSVADLTLNPANTLGRIVSPLEACNHIRAQTPKVFDPTLLAHFSRLLVERKLDGAFLSDQSVHGIEKLLG
jgi:Type II secretion system (T2SS), protein E, N-terminal domain/HD domain